MKNWHSNIGVWHYKSKIMTAKLGQYYYAPKGRHFRIYRYTSVTETCSSASLVLEEPMYADRQSARKRVYELNGWTMPVSANSNNK